MICERCNKKFECGVVDGLAAGQSSCWCASMPALKALPQDFKNCLCPDCLKSFTKPEVSTTSVEPAPLIENEDYYYEDGYMVMTEKYHLKRGVCCGSGCRHCPY